MSTRTRVTVLIVGGGFAGRSACNYLRSKSLEANLVLVDEKPYFEFTPSVLRCIVQPTRIRSVTFEHAGEGFTFILGRVTHITQREAIIDRENDSNVKLSVPFDYCVWATGVGFCHPISSGLTVLPSVAQRVAEMGRQQEAVARARQVLIVGGGAVGVELMAEFAGVIQDSSVTLTLASPRILPRLPPSAGDYATRWLHMRNVRILHERLKPLPNRPGMKYEYISESGETLQADLVFDCTGPRSNDAANALIDGGVCDASSVNRDGSINVLETLQIPQSPHIFVAGDAARVNGELELSRLGGEKTAYAAQEAGVLAAQNVVVQIHGERLRRRTPGVLQSYPTDVFPIGIFPRMFVISLYKFHGVLCIGPLVITGRIPAFAKVVIEFLGIRTAKSNGLSAKIFGIIEVVMFWATALLTMSWKSSRRPSGD